MKKKNGPKRTRTIKSKKKIQYAKMNHEIHESLAALCTAAAAQSTAPHIILDCLKHLLDLWSRCAPPPIVCLEEKNSFKIAIKITSKLRKLYRRTCDVLLSDVHRDWLGCFSSAEIISSFDSFFHPSVVQPILVLESLLASLEKRERREEVVVEEEEKEEEKEEEEERGRPANGDGRKAALSVAHSNVLHHQQVVRETLNERRARVAKYASLLRKLVVGIKEEEEEEKSHSSDASSMLLGSSLGSSLLHLVLSEGERQRAVDLHRSILVVPDITSKSLR